ncbi:hypothetical protein HYDPIDRAFT_118142 [Hydnomerulius pinastri MD-312]|uniref:ribonuclease H n=1 Tax=Hydnomerulius pinastri MD-312 TaxID=994086 RepID=A0A0C9W996_9AGAM|nr:hypothetical protein HYDPIDRAFT_118142 [Hydnomerulius pinastri MD-312]
MPRSQRPQEDFDSESEPNNSRRFTPCPGLSENFKTDKLVLTCKGCHRFFALCCHHYDPDLGLDEQTSCHRDLVVYTDGACSNNGRDNAAAGIGIAWGPSGGNGDNVLALPIDDTLDPGGMRTSQRAELLAAFEGLKRICDFEAEHLAKRRKKHSGDDSDMPVIVITTDSLYVVKGMTEWLPVWKAQGLRKVGGGQPSNLDLFHKLEAEAEARERRYDCKVKFWHIARKYNHIADGLAKRGAQAAKVNKAEHAFSLLGL